MRLLLAGIRQMASPAFTADAIFGIKDKAVEVIVRELVLPISPSACWAACRC
jgi:hypothetical protein